MLSTEFVWIVEDIRVLLNSFLASQQHINVHTASVELAKLYNPLRDRAGHLASSFNASQKAEAKDLVERTITPLLMYAPMPRRAYDKPRGYAGDYLMMLDIYNDSEQAGHNIAHSALHHMFCNHPLSQGVIIRSQHVVRRIVDLKPNKITSIGCGPAMEMRYASRFVPEAVWTLVDQDWDALEYAYEHATYEKVQLQICNMRDLVRGTDNIADNQDLIYCLGLYDYLHDEVARSLTIKLFEALAPGGTLLIANAAGPRVDYFDPEFILDWPLIYRTDDSMWDMTLGTEASECKVNRIPGKAYWILELRK